MADFRDIKIVHVTARKHRVQPPYNAGTIWYELSESPEKEWKNEFIGAYNYLRTDDSNRQYSHHFPPGENLSEFGHLSAVEKGRPHIVIPIEGVGVDKIKDWLTHLVEDCVKKANENWGSLRKYLKQDAASTLIKNWPDDSFKACLSMDPELTGDIVEAIWRYSSRRCFRDLVIENGLEIQRLSLCPTSF